MQQTACCFDSGVAHAPREHTLLTLVYCSLHLLSQVLSAEWPGGAVCYWLVYFPLPSEPGESEDRTGACSGARP